MAPLSKLTLTSYRRTHPNRDPVEERRSKTLAALTQQKLVLEAALKGQEHTITKPGWAHVCNVWHRLADLQKAEGWVFLMLVPVFNVFFFLYLVLWRSKAATYLSRTTDLREYSNNPSGRVIPPLTRKNIEKNDT